MTDRLRRLCNSTQIISKTCSNLSLIKLAHTLSFDNIESEQSQDPMECMVHHHQWPVLKNAGLRAVPSLLLMSRSLHGRNPKGSTFICARTSISTSVESALQRSDIWRCRARRRVRYEEEEEDEKEEYEHNEQIALLELYSQTARGEALVVHAVVDAQDVEVLVFKGYSSCLSYSTSPDPSRSVLPARAIIKSIDRIKGPFDPSNIEYLEKGLAWEAFKSRLASK